jgi:adenine deaminase
LKVKVVVVAMFEVGADTDDVPGEFQFWVERRKLAHVIPLPLAYHDVRTDGSGLIGTVTGMGTAKAATSIVALGLNPRFGDLTPKKIGAIFDRWPEAVALGEKMDFIQVVEGDPRAHAILAEALRRARPVCGHIYGRPFVAAYAASGVSDTHEAIDQEIAEDFLEAGLWLFLRGGPPTTPWNSLPQAIKVVTQAGVSPKRVCVCTDDRDADDLFLFGLDWVVREAVECGMPSTTAWSCGSLHPATRYSLDNELGALGASRRADIVLLNDELQPQATWFGGKLVVNGRRPTETLERALERRYRYPDRAYRTVSIKESVPLTPSLPHTEVRANLITSLVILDKLITDY